MRIMLFSSLLTNDPNPKSAQKAGGGDEHTHTHTHTPRDETGLAILSFFPFYTENFFFFFFSSYIWFYVFLGVHGVGYDMKHTGVTYIRGVFSVSFAF
jgi:hypothetical protein